MIQPLYDGLFISGRILLIVLVSYSLFSVHSELLLKNNQVMGQSGSDQSSLPTGITLTTNEQIYTPGERVVIRGVVHPPVVAGNLLLLTTITPDGEFHLQDKSEITRDGAFTRNLVLPPDAELGQWRITAVFSDKEAEITITVLDPDTTFDKVVERGLVFVDGQGNEIVSSTASQRVQVVSRIASDEEEGQQPYILLAQIIDSRNNFTVSIVFSSGTLLPGQTASPSVQWIPEREGQYVVELFIWDSLDRPVPLVKKQTASLDVVA